MFRITSATTTSLSFSWQDPINPNGAITGYRLSCQSLLLDIPTPEPLSPGPTDRMTILVNLLPGVRYNCSIGASNGAGPSNPVYADGTTTEIGRDCICCHSLIPRLPPDFIAKYLRIGLRRRDSKVLFLCTHCVECRVLLCSFIATCKSA